MVDWKTDNIYLFHDDEKATLIIGKESNNNIIGQYGSMPWDEKLVLNNFRSNLSTMPLDLYKGIGKEGFNKTGKKLIIVPYFIDNNIAQNAISPTIVENDKLRYENEMLKRIINGLRDKLFSKTGKDSFNEERIRIGKVEGVIRREYYKTDDSQGFGGMGYRNYLPYYGSRFSTPQTTEESEGL